MRRLFSRTALAALLVAPLVGAAAGPAEAADQRFALIIGENTADDPALEPLRFADDDALRWGELLGHLGSQRTLTRLDTESARLWGDAQHPVPTRAAVLEALGAIRAEMAAARQAGHRPILTFVYSGHGNYDAEGRGYLHLADGRFTTRDLYHHVIAPSQGDPVILVVDACNAALLVHSRGAPSLPERRRAGETRLRLEAWPNVGVVLASSSVGETHEWGRYLAGVFGHEVRSALMGPGDIDDDGRVGFAELAAFVSAANERVANPTVRVTPYVRPPLTDPDLALMDLGEATFPLRVRIERSTAGRGHVVDEQLVRYADWHKRGDTTFWVALPRVGRFALVLGDEEYVVPEGATGALTLAELEPRIRTALRSRGASEYFDRTLFHEPFDLAYADGYLRGHWVEGLALSRLEPTDWYRNSAAWTVGGAGLAAAAGGALLHSTAFDLSDQAHAEPNGRQRERLNQQARTREVGAWTLYGVGAAATVGSALWMALERPLIERHYRPPLAVTVTPGGLVVEADF